MNALTTLKTANNFLEFLFNFGWLLEETDWEFGPCKSSTHHKYLNHNSFFFKLNHFLRSLALIIIFLFLQAAAYLASLILELIISALEDKKKKLTPYTVLKFGIKLAIAASLITVGIVACLLFAKISAVIYWKALLINYIVTSTIDLFLTLTKFAKNIFLKLNADPGADFSLKNFKQNLKKNTAELILITASATLTIFSFSSIPIVSNIAQIALIILAIFCLCKFIYERYKHYQESKPKLIEGKLEEKALEKEPNAPEKQTGISSFLDSISKTLKKKFCCVKPIFPYRPIPLIDSTEIIHNKHNSHLKLS